MWVVRLSDKQLEVLRALLRSEEHLGPALQGALEGLDLARWDDLPEAELPWNVVSDQAELQGITEADVIWDMAGRRKEAAGPRIKPPAKRPAKRAANGRRKSTT